MASTRPSPGRRTRTWQVATGLTAFTLAGAGCAITAPVGAPTRGLTALTPDGLLVGPARAGAFPIVERNGQLICTGCNAVLNRDGSHPLAAMITKNLQFMKSGDALKAARVKPGEHSMREFLPYALLKLGLGKHIGIVDATVARTALAALEAKPFDYSRAGTRHVLSSCCVPDGTPTSDPPY